MQADMKKDLSKKSAIILILALAVVLLLPFAAPRHIVGHDTMFHVLRIEYLADSIRHGEWWPSLFPDANDGYGYGTPLFYSNFMLYIPALLALFGMESLAAFELYLAIIAVAAVFGSYFSFKELFKSRFAAVVGTALYLGSYYFCADIVVRAAFGETLAFAVLPLLFLGIYRSAIGNYRLNLPLMVGFFLVAVSHNLSLLMMGILFFIFILLNVKRYLREPARIGYLALDALVVVLLAGFFLFPMGEQLLCSEFFTKTTLGEFNPHYAGVRIANLFIEIGTDNYDYTPSLGLTMAAVLLLFLVVPKAAKGDDMIYLRNICILASFACIFMSTGYFPYLALDPVFNVLQFPWRWFMPCTLFLAVAGAQMLQRICTKNLIVSALIVLLLCACQYLGVACDTLAERYAAPESAFHRMDDTSEGFWNLDENYMHVNTQRSEWRNNRDGLPHVLFEAEGFKMEGVREWDAYTITFSGNEQAERDSWFEAPLIYYLGYTAVDENGNELEVRPSWRGYLDVHDIRESGTIIITYQKTLIQRVSPAVSLISAAAFVAYIIICEKRAKESVTA